MEANKKRKREVQEENKGNEIIRYDQETFTLRELYLIQQLLLPREMKKINDIEGNHHDIKLVLEKKLCQIDVGKYGFIIPEYQILEDARVFLKPNEGNHHDIKLVLEKKLCQIDVGKYGFIIPEYQILEDARDFLKPNEVLNLKKNMRNISVKLLDQNLKEYKLNLCWRKLDSFYNLIQGWLEVVRNNNLKQDEKVQLWSFRRDDNELGFALVKLTQ